MGELDEYFRTLGLGSDASWSQVADAWRTLSKEHHPDTKECGSHDQLRAQEFQKQLNVAYERLKGYFNDGSARAVLASCKNFDEFFGTGFSANVGDSGAPNTTSYQLHMETEFNRACRLANANSANYDLAKAVSIFKSIAVLGHGNAQFRLGYIYFDGIMRDLTQAAYWWQRAAESGNVNGQFNLALLYERGLGIARDQAKARLWFERAARNGDREAAGIVSRLGAGTLLRKPNYWFRGA